MLCSVARCVLCEFKSFCRVRRSGPWKFTCCSKSEQFRRLLTMSTANSIVFVSRLCAGRKAQDGGSRRASFHGCPRKAYLTNLRWIVSIWVTCSIWYEAHTWTTIMSWMNDSRILERQHKGLWRFITYVRSAVQQVGESSGAFGMHTLLKKSKKFQFVKHTHRR